MIVIDDKRPLIMGILNVTPDSFSDGGRFLQVNEAVEHARRMVTEGADMIDIGGESTRPGSLRVSADEQQRRVREVIEAVRGALPEKILISIDTTLAEVAESALKTGAGVINDISAGRDDPRILEVVSRHHCPYIMMHMQGTPETMQDNPVYDDVVEEVRAFLLERAQVAMQAGIKRENIIIDPGIGFGKTRAHNLELMANLHRFVDTGFPVLLGTSRKRFMASICADATPDQFIGATCATTVLGISAGVKLFRVHDVQANRQAADVAWTILNQSD